MLLYEGVLLASLNFPVRRPGRAWPATVTASPVTASSIIIQLITYFLTAVSGKFVDV
jgi:hypothetical protein